MDGTDTTEQRNESKTQGRSPVEQIEAARFRALPIRRGRDKRRFCEPG
jgi:hypothetical protein